MTEEDEFDRQQREEEEGREKKHRPELSEVGVNIHRHVKYRCGPVPCDGQLDVVEAFGETGEMDGRGRPTGSRYLYAWALLKCLDCGATVSVPNPRRREIKKQEAAPHWQD